MSTTEIISTLQRVNDITITRNSNGIIITAKAITEVGKLKLRQILDIERLKEGTLFYTLGNPVSYSIALLEPYLKKLGKEKDYPGGCVFKTKEDAVIHSQLHNLKYKPYGLIIKNVDTDIDWSKETDEGFGRLLIDSFIVNI